VRVADIFAGKSAALLAGAFLAGTLVQAHRPPKQPD